MQAKIRPNINEHVALWLLMSSIIERTKLTTDQYAAKNKENVNKTFTIKYQSPFLLFIELTIIIIMSNIFKYIII